VLSAKLTGPRFKAQGAIPKHVEMVEKVEKVEWCIKH